MIESKLLLAITAVIGRQAAFSIAGEPLTQGPEDDRPDPVIRTRHTGKAKERREAKRRRRAKGRK